MYKLDIYNFKKLNYKHCDSGTHDITLPAIACLITLGLHRGGDRVLDQS